MAGLEKIIHDVFFIPPLKPLPILIIINNNINNNKNVLNFSSIKKWGKIMREEFSFFEQFEHLNTSHSQDVCANLLHDFKEMINLHQKTLKAIWEFCTKF